MKLSNVLLKLNLKYKQKLYLTMFVLIFIPVLILATFLISNYIKQTTVDINNKLNEELKVYQDTVNNEFIRVGEKLNYIKGNTKLRRVLSTNYENNLTKLYDANEYINEFIDTIFMGQFEEQVMLYTYNNNLYNSNYVLKTSFLDPKIVHELELLPPHENLWVIVEDGNRFTEPYILAYSIIINISDPLAIVEIAIPVSKIKGGLTNNESNNEIIILENSNQFVSAKGDKAKAAEIIKKIKIGAAIKAISIQKGSLVNGFKIYMAKLDNNYAKQFYKIMIILLFAIVVLTIVILYAIKITTTSLTKRLTQVIDLINTDINTWIDEETQLTEESDEFDEIIIKFKEHSKMIQNFYKQISQYEKDFKNMEMNLLQERINPHFLYNTLSAINWVYADDKLEKIINDLVGYYRIALNKGDIISTVERELDMIEKYINIQRFAYNSEFSYTINIQDEVKNKQILKQLIQPIVENAVLHGVNKKKMDGILEINAFIRNQLICISVKDNGYGMDESIINNILNYKEGNNDMGYGTKNVIQRIKNYYGEEYGLIIKSNDLGTVVEIEIPIK